MRIALVALLLLLVTGCAHRSAGAPATTDGVMPADFAGTVEYGNGSVPPRHHYEWVLRFDDSTAVVEWTPGYQEVEPWRESADITGEQRERLYERLRDLGLFDLDLAEDAGMVGGPTGRVEVTADGRTHDPGGLGDSEASADLLAAVAEAVRVLFPEEVWRALADKQEAWGREPK